MPTFNDYLTYKKLVVCSQDEIWSESVAGTLTQVTGAVVDTTDQITMAEIYEKVCVANGSTLGVIDFTNTELTCPALTTPPLKGDTLTQDTSGAIMLVDFVNAAKTKIYGRTLTTTAFNTSNTVSSDNAGSQTMDPSTFTPSAVAEAYDDPIWYTWTKHPSKTTALPDKAYLVCRYRGRAVLSGNPDDPHQWYMSRQGDIFDFDYSSTDAQAAVAGNNANAGKVGDIVKALIPFGDDYLVFGCASSMWILRGDPVVGGDMDERSGTGIYSNESWCRDNAGHLYFWGANGIYQMKNTGSTLGLPVCISEVSLPKLIDDEGASQETHRITMGFDKKRNGIFVSITKVSDGSNSCYFYSILTGGFFPESYQTQGGCFSQFYYDATDPDYADLLVGCTDGYIRKFSDSDKDDNIGGTTAAIDSYVTLLANISNNDDRNGVMNSMTVITSGGESSGAESDTDGVDYEVHVGDCAETAIERVEDGETALHSGTFTGPGRHNRIRKRARASWLAIKLSNDTASESWSLEKIMIVSNSKGRIR